MGQRGCGCLLPGPQTKAAAPCGSSVSRVWATTACLHWQHVRVSLGVCLTPMQSVKCVSVLQGAVRRTSAGGVAGALAAWTPRTQFAGGNGLCAPNRCLHSVVSVQDRTVSFPLPSARRAREACVGIVDRATRTCACCCVVSGSLCNVRVDDLPSRAL